MSEIGGSSSIVEKPKILNYNEILFKTNRFDTNELYQINQNIAE